MPLNDLSGLRTQLVHRGYKILPNRGKVPSPAGWNDPAFVAKELTDGPKGTAAERVASWEKRFPDAVSTGLLIINGLVVLDLDIDDLDAVDNMVNCLEVVARDVWARGPTRYGSGHKLAIVCRLADGEEPFVRRASRIYNGHCLEVFGGKTLKAGRASRQFGIYGPHSFNEDGSVAREYVWAEGPPALHEIDLADLPVITVKQVHALIDDFEDYAKAEGWGVAEAPEAEASSSVYDITEETRFWTDRGGEGISYEELCDQLDAYGEVRCSSSFIGPGRGDSGNTSRCWVFRHPKGYVGVHVYGEENHYPVDRDPARRREAIEQEPEATSRPADGAGLTDKAEWLRLNYGYCALSDTVVELHKPQDDCLIKPAAFGRLYRSWREEVVGPKGGKTFAYATGAWEVDPARVDVEAVRMRPDQPFPVYREEGRLFKNTYLRPSHTGSGDIAPWLAFMAHLLPIAAERDWFCNWLAHKHLNPGVPGVAVIMVAAGPDGPVYGAGRGMLRDIIARLLGPKYVRPIDFDVFTGKSAQGVYTDWSAFSVMVTVNEARDTGDSGRWAERRAIYERLKEVVDPRAIERTFIVKGGQAFRAQAFASYLIASNNRDALQIPADDRRAAALSNGERMPAEMAEALQAWMDLPGNIAELARWLEARDLTSFDVYTPPVTETKTVMQELARSEIDDAYQTVRRAIGPNGLFTTEQVKSAVLREMGDNMPADDVRRWVARRVRADGARFHDYRMPPAQGRHWVLTWRGRTPVPLYGATVEAAQSAVDATGKNLEKAVHHPMSAVILHLPK